MRSVQIGAFVGVAFVALAGCGTEEDGGPNGLAALDHDLTVGSAGSTVRMVNDYLTNYGYFPNERLAREYPAWRPIVSTPPADRDVYDASTEKAVRALQHNMGLPQTGIVDAGTREILRRGRCGVPDGVESLDPSDKFTFLGTANDTNITWWLDNTISSMSRTETELRIAQALAQWAVPTAHTFTKTSINPIMRISFTPNLSDLALGQSKGQGSDIFFKSTIAWSGAGFSATLLHEIGHTLGLGHSMIPNSVMGPDTKSVLGADDIGAAFARKIGWEWFDGIPAVDIAMYNHTQGSELYVLTEPRVPGGYQIWFMHNGDPDQWHQLPGGAVRIAAMNRAPWVVNDGGNIFSWNGSGWDLKSGCATDIAMGGDGSVWIIGCNAVAGGREIFKWNGSGWNLVPGGAVRISVGLRNVYETNAHVPWLVNDQGRIFRRTGADPFSGAWDLMPGSATDIAASPTGITFILENQAVDGGFRVAIANEQGPGTLEPFVAPQFRWTRTGGAALGIATDSYGYPFLVNNLGSWRTK